MYENENDNNPFNEQNDELPNETTSSENESDNEEVDNNNQETSNQNEINNNEEANNQQQDEQQESGEEEAGQQEQGEGQSPLGQIAGKAADMAVEGGKEVAKTAVKAGVKSFIASNPVVIVAIVAILGIILFILILTGMSANATYDDNYLAPTYWSVQVTDENGEEHIIEVEDFVVMMVYSIEQEVTETSSGFLNALAITFRTSIQTNDTNIYDISDFKYFDLIILDTTSEEYSLTQSKISSTTSVVLTRNSSYINVTYDAFCYDSLEEDYYILAQKGLKVPVEWAENNITNYNYLNCPCNQESDDDVCSVDTEQHGTGLSIYGALYLGVEQSYNYTQILKYFFGDDIEYMTNDKSAATSNALCDANDINVLKTQLSRTEFVSLVEDYLSSYSSTKANLYRTNAGAIYDLGLEVGANPELIYIIVTKEGSWDSTFDGGQDRACYNYYGYGVYNGQASSNYCWDSLLEGVTYMMEYFKNKGSLDAIVSVYSYLGTYLANPGSWGDGGCIYLTLDEIYGSDYSRCSSSYSCASSNGGDGCVLTTDDEKQAYIDWQKQKYLEHRETIFNISAENCTIYLGNLNLDTGSLTTEGTTELHTSLREYLPTVGSSVQELNDLIYQNVIEAGVSTRAGAVTAGVTLISYLSSLGVHLPYTYGGNAGTTGTSISSFYGADPDWGKSFGTSGLSTSIGTKYYYFGPDCSAFITWVLRNGGYNYTNGGSSGIGALGENIKLTTDPHEEAQAGDLLYRPSTSGSTGHVQMIIYVDTENQVYKTIEASGKDAGVRVGEVSFTSSSYYLVKMDNYYSNSGNVNSSYESLYPSMVLN